MKKEIILKYLNNQCSHEELEEVVRWVNTVALEDDGREWGRQNWNNLQLDDNENNDEKFDLIFDRIQKKIERDKLVKEKTTIGSRKIKVLTSWLTRAAAILFIPVIGLLSYHHSKEIEKTLSSLNYAVDSLEILAPMGSRAVVHLSDGSEVHLNYGSKLKYPQVFNDCCREVELVGEGYFNVAHNPDKPFSVNSGIINVKALGTSFNVMAYPNSNAVETTLVKGKVVLELNKEDGMPCSLGSMIPGQHVNYDTKTGVIISTQGQVEDYIAWKDGKLVFKDTPILKVAERIGRMYNADIEIKDEVADYYYTVTFVDETLIQILDLMAMATPITYEVLPRTKLNDGTFSKQKIVISKRTNKMH